MPRTSGYNLRRAVSMISALRAARARIAWCMVGTAVYQVGLASLSQPKKRSASKPGAPPDLAARAEGGEGTAANEASGCGRAASR